MRARLLIAGAAAGLLVVGAGVPAVFALSGGPDLAPGAAELRQGQADAATTWRAGEPRSTDVQVAALPAGASSVQRVVLGAGCRLFDTRAGSTPAVITAGAFRDFSTQNASLVAQGGSATGCNIPTDATAIELSLSTVGGSPTKPGLLRAGAGGAAPTATVLQFLAGQGTSVTTSVPLNGAEELRVAAAGGATHVVGDALAYYRGVLNATVDVNGVLFAGTGVAAIDKLQGSLGTYYVTFNRSISECIPAISGAFGFAAWGLLIDSDTVAVVTVDWAGTAADAPFHVTMSC
jgi:hypothetical protein